MEDITILYYTANRDREEFEQKIRDNILELKGDLPIVSVSHKPIDFGENICIGLRDVNYNTEFEQIRIGLENIKTRYVLIAESDTLYPPEYFKFYPKKDYPCYRYDNVWVLFARFNNNRYHFKGVSHCGQMIDRDLWLQYIKEKGIFQFKDNKHRRWTGSPIITFKTTMGVKSVTYLDKLKLPKRNLPYWGNSIELKNKFYGQENSA
jgi:hypothetical protein